MRLIPLVAALALCVASVIALTATNIVSGGRVGATTQAINANALRPPQCAALVLTTISVGSGTFSGTNAPTLLLGSAGVDRITGGSGSDCILAGAGNDRLDGRGGVDVCIGGAGTDTFARCETAIQ